MFGIFAGLAGSILYRKRPAALYRHVIENRLSFDAAIVPGVPFENGTWDSVMKGRVLWAGYLYKQGIIRNIIFSGGAVYTPFCEAKIMGLYAVQLGIPKQHIFYETRAEHSTENIYYSYELARKLGFKTISLVTDPYQSLLTKRFTKRRFDTPIYHIPFIIDTLKKLNDAECFIDPRSAYEQNFKSILERENYFHRLRGTFGAFIPWENSRRKRASAL